MTGSPPTPPRYPSNWETIWSNKVVDCDPVEILTALMKADGFDTGCGTYSIAQWNEMVRGAARRTRTGPQSKVLEIGCGAGAFLYTLHRLTGCSYSGIDYSEQLIDGARKYLPLGQFVVSEATHIPFENNQFDAIFSHSVFHYFPSLDYAQSVLVEAYKKLKPGGILCLMDLNNSDCRIEYDKERKRNYVDPAEYDERYRNLPHLFFEKNELERLLLNIGYANVSFFEHDVPEYINSRFRFNLLAAKNV